MLLTPENKTAIIPNGAMANVNILKYSNDGQKRLDLTFGVSYREPLDKVRKVLEHLMASDPNVCRNLYPP